MSARRTPVVIGSRWHCGHRIERDDATGAYSEMNPPLDSKAARKIQAALLAGPKLPDFRRSLASAAMPTVPPAQPAADALEERTGVRAVIAELHAAPADVPLPMPGRLPPCDGLEWGDLRASTAGDINSWRYYGSKEWRRATYGRLEPDTAVALAALAIFAIVTIFGDLF